MKNSLFPPFYGQLHPLQNDYCKSYICFALSDLFGGLSNPIQPFTNQSVSIYETMPLSSGTLEAVASRRAIWLSAGWLKKTIKVEMAQSAHSGGINKRTYLFYLTYLLFSRHFLFSEIFVLILCFPGTSHLLKWISNEENK